MGRVTGELLAQTIHGKMGHVLQWHLVSLACLFSVQMEDKNLPTDLADLQGSRIVWPS